MPTGIKLARSVPRQLSSMSAYVQTEPLQVLNVVFAFRGVFYDPLRELRLNALNQCSPRCPGHAILATRYQKPAPKRLAHATRRQGYVLFCEALDVPPLGAQTLGQRSPTKNCR